MQLRLTILAIGISAAAFGCATADQQTTAATPSAAPAVSAPQPQERYVTGSRLPVRDDSGTGSVSSGNKSAWEDEMRRSASGSACRGGTC